MAYDRPTRVSHVLPKQRCQKIFAVTRAFIWGPADGFMPEGQSNYIGKGIQSHEVRLSDTALAEYVLINIIASIMAHVHCTAATLDTVPCRKVTHGKVVFPVGNVARELQSARQSDDATFARVGQILTMNAPSRNRRLSKLRATDRSMWGRALRWRSKRALW